MSGEGNLRIEIDTSLPEIRIEGLLGFPVRPVEMLELVIFEVERTNIPFGIDDSGVSVFDGVIQQTVANEVDKSVLVHTWCIVIKQVGMFLDEADDIVVFLNGGLEATETIARDDELIATDASAVAVQSDIRRITKSVTLVQRVTGIHQNILNADSALEIIVS